MLKGVRQKLDKGTTPVRSTATATAEVVNGRSMDIRVLSGLRISELTRNSEGFRIYIRILSECLSNFGN